MEDLVGKPRFVWASDLERLRLKALFLIQQQDAAVAELDGTEDESDPRVRLVALRQRKIDSMMGQCVSMYRGENGT